MRTQDLLIATALRPAYNLASRVAIVPTAGPSYYPPLVLDSACGEEVCGRNKGNAVEGCNVKCTANQCTMRSEATQYHCEDVTPEMSQMYGFAGELHHALESCAALKVWVSTTAGRVGVLVVPSLGARY